MLRDEVELYSKLTGEDGWNVPIIKIGAYLDGYAKGLEAGKYTNTENLIAAIKSDIDTLTRYQLTDKTQTISKNAVDRVFNLHLYGTRDANGKKAQE